MQSIILRRASPRALLNSNLTRTVFCKPTQLPKYRLRLALPSDYDRVVGFMQETYMRTEPSIVNIGLSGTAAGCPSLVNQMHRHISQGMTFIVEDLEDCLAAAAVNLDTRREGVKAPGYYASAQRHECESPQAGELLDFFSHVSRESDLWRAYRVKNVFECAHVAVHPDHQGRGLARRLVLESWLLARDMAYRLFRIDCSSIYTAKIAERLGWECVYAMPYGRYFANGEFVFRHVQEPHCELRVFVDQLKYTDGYLPPSKKPRCRG